jgi:hypothetical protein
MEPFLPETALQFVTTRLTNTAGSIKKLPREGGAIPGLHCTSTFPQRGMRSTDEPCSWRPRPSKAGKREGNPRKRRSHARWRDRPKWFSWERHVTACFGLDRDEIKAAAHPVLVVAQRHGSVLAPGDHQLTGHIRGAARLLIWDRTKLHVQSPEQGSRATENASPFPAGVAGVHAEGDYRGKSH